MDPKRNDLKERLLAQQVSDPERLAEYRKGVEAMLDQLRRESWWVGLAQACLVILGVVVLLFVAAVLGFAAFCLPVGQNASLTGNGLPALGALLSLLGAVALVWHLNRRSRKINHLLEVNRLEMRVLDLEEAQRNRGEK
jgi:hypothetical protein